MGALLEFAEHGWTDWISVAGTSAGSIIAAYLACGHGPDDLEKLLRETPYEKFQDWGAGGKVIGGGLNLLRHHGLAHGEYFHQWFLEQTEEKTFGDVKKTGKTLKLIASDVANKELLVLPDDLVKYRQPGGTDPIDPDSYRIADAARMSMSIPYFFQPVELVNIETKPARDDRGRRHALELPRLAVRRGRSRRDPPDLRLPPHRRQGRRRRHSASRQRARLAGPARLGDVPHGHGGLGQALHVALDRGAHVPGRCRHIGATDFDLTKEQQDWLLNSGKTAAAAFLADFKLEDYVNTFGKKLTPTAAAV